MYIQIVNSSTRTYICIYQHLNNIIEHKIIRMISILSIYI